MLALPPAPPTPTQHEFIFIASTIGASIQVYRPLVLRSLYGRCFATAHVSLKIHQLNLHLMANVSSTTLRMSNFLMVFQTENANQQHKCQSITIYKWWLLLLFVVSCSFHCNCFFVCCFAGLLVYWLVVES